MTAIELVNLALLKIGVSKAVVTLTEESREAYTAALLYDHTLRLTLRQFPWAFATKYADLELVAGRVWDDDDALVQTWDIGADYAVGDVVRDNDVIYYCILAHTVAHEPPNVTYWSEDVEDEPEQVNGDWLYAYRWPEDCLFARRLVASTDIGRKFDANPIAFRVGTDATDLLIYTNERDAELEYTKIDCAALFADDLWIDAFTWRLAAQLAPSLSEVKGMTETCMTMFAIAVRLASTVGSNEQQQEKPGDADWIAARD